MKAAERARSTCDLGNPILHKLATAVSTSCPSVAIWISPPAAPSVGAAGGAAVVVGAVALGWAGVGAVVEGVVAAGAGVAELEPSVVEGATVFFGDHYHHKRALSCHIRVILHGTLIPQNLTLKDEF